MRIDAKRAGSYSRQEVAIDDDTVVTGGVIVVKTTRHEKNGKVTCRDERKKSDKLIQKSNDMNKN